VSQKYTTMHMTPESLDVLYFENKIIIFNLKDLVTPNITFNLKDLVTPNIIFNLKDLVTPNISACRKINNLLLIKVLFIS
jgi:hypothetical protein